MADYYPLLARALDGLTENSREARALVYERATAALMGQLRAVQPPLSEEAIARESSSLEEAVAKAEAKYATDSAETETMAAPATEDRITAPDAAPIKRGRRRGRALLTAILLFAVIVPIAVVAWLWRDQPAKQAAAPATPAPTRTTPPPATNDPKFPERVGGQGQPAGQQPTTTPAAPATPSPAGTPAPAQPDLPVAQKAALVEENTQDPQQPKVTSGRALWRLDVANAGQGQPLETVVRATVDVPEAGITLQLAMKRNRDQTLPASHTLELTFTTPAGDANRTVRDVNPPLFRGEDGTRGLPVAALSVPVKENFFLIGLSDLRGDLDRNSELVRNRNWIELPLRFTSGQRATLIFEKGVTGDRVITEAYKAWSQP